MKNSKNLHIYLGLAVFLVSFIALLVPLHDYGATWDEPDHLNNVLQNTRFFTAGTVLYENDFDKYYAPWPNAISAISYVVLHEKFYIMSKWDSYHFGNVIMGSIVVLLTFLIVYQLTKKPWLATIVAMILLLLPRFFGDAHNCPKDLPIMMWVNLTIYLAILAYQSGKLWHLLLMAASMGFLLSTKLSTVAVPTVLIVWWFTLNLFHNQKGLFKSRVRKVLPVLYSKRTLLVVAVTILFFYLASPYFLLHPVAGPAESFQFYSTANTGYLEGYLGQKYDVRLGMPWHYPFVMIAVTTPVIILVLFIVGLTIAIYRLLSRKIDPLEALAVYWFFFVMLLFAHSGAFNGIRQFLYVLPAIAILAAIGGFYVYETSKKIRIPHRWLNIAWAVLLLVGFAWSMHQIAQIHPFQSFYFNEPIGGISGASGNFRVQYWEQYMKDNADYLNEYARPSSRIYTTQGGFLLREYVRPDLVVIEDVKRADYVITENPQIDYPPVFVVLADDYPLSFIYDADLIQNALKAVPINETTT